jgi:hypothetical protein
VAAGDTEQFTLLAESGWNTCGSVREGVAKVGLPVPTAAYLRRTFDERHWQQVDGAVDALYAHFAGVRFADDATFGALLVPDPDKLDTRGAVDPEIRRDQLGVPTEDVVDKQLPGGALVIPPGNDWTLVATITGAAGIHFGSYRHIRDGDAETYTVDGVDTRDLMVRQIWGARVLQSGKNLPDCEIGGGWTFTLFPGEDLVGGRAVSGTILYNKVRFRLGSPDRGIAVVRVCPGVVIR